MLRVLIVTSGYLPGFRFGGPVQSLAALVEQLGDEIEFSIVTSDRDLGSSEPYPEKVVNSWNQVGKARVWYSSARRLSPFLWRQLLVEQSPNVIYLNSLFDPITNAILFWRKARLIPDVPIVLVPRGELANGALAIKSTKKRTLLAVAKPLCLHAGISWHASSSAEETDIRAEFGNDLPVTTIRNLATKTEKRAVRPGKEPGSANFVWLGRIARNKNLLQAIELLGNSSGKIRFATYGPIEDEAYWEECATAANTLSANVTFEHHGAISHDTVPGVLSQYHFLLFPTWGENFGHTIVESLSQGLPSIISDRTPWRHLEAANAGWDLPIDEGNVSWMAAIEKCIAMNNEEYIEMSISAEHFIDASIGHSETAKDLHRLFVSSSRTT